MTSQGLLPEEGIRKIQKIIHLMVLANDDSN